MEKLQRALEMARASRKERENGKKDHKVITAEEREVSELWDALPTRRINQAHLLEKRIVTYKGSADGRHYDILRTRIRDEGPRKGLKRIAVISPGPQAGKSTTLANIAFAFARLPYMRTMVFDFDLRRPALHKLMGIQPEQSVDEMIEGKVPFEKHMVRVGRYKNMALGLNNASVENPSELLQGDDIRDFLDAVQGTYEPDLMLFDMPPFMVADDTHGFLHNVDAVILLAEAEVTSMSQLDLVERKLSQLTKVLGIVLNKCNYPDELGSQAYYYYYSDKKPDTEEDDGAE